MTSAMSSFRKSKPSVGPYWRDSARFSLDISAFMRSKRSCGKLSVAGRPPARDITSGRAVRLIRSRMADDRMTPVRSAYLSSYLSNPRLVMPPSLSRLRIAASIGARPGWGNPDAPLYLRQYATVTGMGAGFSGLSGLRAFMPLGLLGLASHLDLWAGLDLGGTPFALLENSWVIAALLILAAFEMAADKVPLLDSIQDVVATPLRAIAGALIFAAIMQNQGTAALMASGLAGGAIAATAHAGKTVVRAGATTTGAGVANPFISFFEDLLT